MRGVAGILFVFLGLVMGYMVLSGKFPNGTNAGTNYSTDPNAPPILNPGQTATQISPGNTVISGPNGIQGVGSKFGLSAGNTAINGPNGILGVGSKFGSGGNSNDLAASLGGMK